MLRITATRRRDSTPVLRLEGKLVGPWVAELSRVFGDMPYPPARLSLDLSAVTFADRAGLELLRDLLRRGAALAGCSGFIAAVLHVERS
jgi:hypothetical protein